MDSSRTPTPGWQRQAAHYRRQAKAYAAELDAILLRQGAGRARSWSLDFSDEAAQAMYAHETYGVGDLSLTVFTASRLNGYAFGKHLLNLQLDMYREGLARGLTTKAELRADPTLDQAWLAEVLPSLPAGAHALSEILLRERHARPSRPPAAYLPPDVAAGLLLAWLGLAVVRWVWW